MIDKTRFYKPSEVIKLHPWFDDFRASNRGVKPKFYWLLDSKQLKTYPYQDRSGNDRHQILGQDIIDFLKGKGLN